MSFEQIAIILLLAATLAAFAWNRLRVDLVAVGALLVAVLLGLVPQAEAFSGFGNPAVVTVAAVLVVGRALTLSGAVQRIGLVLERVGRGPGLQAGLLCTFGAAISGFMNNVGALALLLPLAIRTSRRSGRQPAAILMPLSFATLLGGTLTLVGTPPNILIAQYRISASGEPFHLFDFAPVGLALCAAGLLYLVTIGWRLIPSTRRGRIDPDASFEIASYATEMRIPARSRAAGLSVMAFEESLKGRLVVLGIVRGQQRVIGLIRLERLEVDDLLIVQADTETLQSVLSRGDLALAEPHPPAEGPFADVAVLEVVVPRQTWIVGATAASLEIRSRFGVNLLAISRHGQRLQKRLRAVPIEPGDVLLLQGDADRLAEAANVMGCLPLAQRRIALGNRRVWLPLWLFLAAIAAAATGVVAAPIAFVAAAAAMVAVRALPLRDLYTAVDWPIIVMLGAMIPVGDALATTGTADLLARLIFDLGGDLPPAATLAIVLLATMLVTPMLNNAATVVIMAPIAIGVAARLGVSADPLLMAVAIGASCDFLTPFGHQNNTIIMGPGGYRPTDYWRVGLPLNLIVLIVGLLVIPAVWPFGLSQP